MPRQWNTNTPCADTCTPSVPIFKSPLTLWARGQQAESNVRNNGGRVALLYGGWWSFHLSKIQQMSRIEVVGCDKT